MPTLDSFGGRLQHDFTGLMTALPDHAAKSFQNLGQSSQVSLRHAEETQTSTKQTLDNLDKISHALAQLRDQKLPQVSMPSNHLASAGR